MGNKELFEIESEQQLIKAPLNFAVCLEPYLTNPIDELLFKKLFGSHHESISDDLKGSIDKLKRSFHESGYLFNIDASKNIHHFYEKFSSMSDEEKDSIHIFFSHRHDQNQDEKIVLEVARKIKEHQAKSTKSICVTIAGIKVEYGSSQSTPPWGFINNKKRELSKHFDILLYTDMLMNPAYWQCGGNSTQGLTFHQALTEKLLHHIAMRRMGKVIDRTSTFDLIDK